MEVLSFIPAVLLHLTDPVYNEDPGSMISTKKTTYEKLRWNPALLTAGVPLAPSAPTNSVHKKYEQGTKRTPAL